ncbi:thiamine-phosphate kinase [Lentibacillus saliphilus]|uniref:thiamine-phosphate kinase n=1 Tax=Lentibacillus saliphilus TaxID=2737028 RepID=UPI001C2F8D2E|nr:thiamine-phosphate kinase [Lentibacillus saliphilus]
MNEFEFINTIKQNAYRQPSLIKGIGDDAAVFRQSSQDVVTAMDTFVEHVHFSKQTMSPSDIGYRVLAANLSDMAAMGAEPAFYLVSIVVGDHWKKNELQDIFKGMQELAKQYSIDLIGGDTVSGHELSITVTVIGYVIKERARFRSAARDGDVVFVTGTLGDAAAGLHMCLHPGEYKDKHHFIRKHIRPEPRIAFARALTSLDRVALNDISDGIANEAYEIADASNVTVHLYNDKIPRHSGLKQFRASDVHNWVYFGGEDFELVGTVPEKDWEKVMTASEQTSVPVTKIGYISADNETGVVYLHDQDEVIRLGQFGYHHF